MTTNTVLQTETKKKMKSEKKKWNMILISLVKKFRKRNLMERDILGNQKRMSLMTLKRMKVLIGKLFLCFDIVQKLEE